MNILKTCIITSLFHSKVTNKSEIFFIVEGMCWSPQYQFKHLAKVMCHLRGDIWHTVVQKYVQ